MPGTYSLHSNSQEEEIAKNYLCSENPNVTVVVVDATCLERNLNLVYQTMELTSNIIVCVNLLDEANLKGIYIDLSKLSKILGVPVVGTIARKKQTLKYLLSKIDDVASGKIKCTPNKVDESDNVQNIIKKAEFVASKVTSFKSSSSSLRDKKIDQILTSKKYGIPIMILFLGVIFWITIVGANYPSRLLSNFFAFLEQKIIILLDFFSSPFWLKSIIVDGIYRTLSWVVSVMLPPMAIFFPLFTFLEDLGYLPRIAFNLDKCFKKCCTSGKQALTMCMGFGCNSAGIIGCRIIDSPRERLIAILTNNFVPCNGRFPFLITMSTIFIGSFFAKPYSSIASTVFVLLLILFGIYMTLLVSKFLSKTFLKGIPSSFVLELPPYRKPQLGKIIVRSIFDRTLFVLGRAIAVAAPTGLIIWLLANINLGGTSILTSIATFIDPFAKIIGFDGYILLAFILGFPANEIVLPIILMSYIAGGSLVNITDISSIATILTQNGWTILTGINAMIFCLLHFPCSTTLITIKKETKSWKWTFLGFVLPTICGIILCMFTTLFYNIIF